MFKMWVNCHGDIDFCDFNFVLLNLFFLAASFLCNMVIDGLGYSFGVLLEPIQREFQVKMPICLDCSDIFSIQLIFQNQTDNSSNWCNKQATSRQVQALRRLLVLYWPGSSCSPAPWLPSVLTGHHYLTDLFWYKKGWKSAKTICLEVSL